MGTNLRRARSSLPVGCCLPYPEGACIINVLPGAGITGRQVNPINDMSRLTAGVVLVMVCSATGLGAQSIPDVIGYSSPTSVRRLSLDSGEVRLTGAEDIDWERVVAIRSLSGGGFVVANAGSGQLYWFDSTGKRVAVAGRKGQGPGEYLSIRDIAVTRGDNVVVMDDGTRRVTILGPGGKVTSTITLQAPFDGGGGPTRMTALSDGTVIVGYSEVTQMSPRPDASYFRQRLFSYSPAGVLRRGPGFGIPESEHFVQEVPAEMGRVAYWNLAFGRIMSVRADSTNILIGDGTDWSVEVRRADGTLRRTHRVARPLAEVTERDRDGYRQAALTGVKPAQRLVVERMTREMPFPSRKPAYRRFEVDDVHAIWIEAWPEPGTTAIEWIRLDRARRTATAFSIPRSFRPFAFAGGRVYGVWRDADDVEHVKAYRLP